MNRQKKQTEGEFWADKLMDLANLSTVVLVFGQLVTPKIEWTVLGVGVVFYILLTIFSKYLRRR